MELDPARVVEARLALELELLHHGPVHGMREVTHLAEQGLIRVISHVVQVVTDRRMLQSGTRISRMRPEGDQEVDFSHISISCFYPLYASILGSPTRTTRSRMARMLGRRWICIRRLRMLVSHRFHVDHTHLVDEADVDPQ